MLGLQKKRMRSCKGTTFVKNVRRLLVDQEQIATAEIFFAHLDQNRSNQIFGEGNFVFSDNLRYLLKSASEEQGEV